MKSVTSPEARVLPEDAALDLLVRQVRDALASLYDLPYLQSHSLARLLSRASMSPPTGYKIIAGAS